MAGFWSRPRLAESIRLSWNSRLLPISAANSLETRRKASWALPRACSVASTCRVSGAREGSERLGDERCRAPRQHREAEARRRTWLDDDLESVRLESPVRRTRRRSRYVPRNTTVSRSTGTRCETRLASTSSTVSSASRPGRQAARARCGRDPRIRSISRVQEPPGPISRKTRTPSA